MKHNQKLNRPFGKIARSGQRGFTLVELLITCVLIGIVGIAIAGFMTTWLGAYSEANARTSLLDNAELALDRITADIRLSGNADENNRWPDPNGPSGDQYGWASDSDTLVLAKVANDKNGNAIFSDPNNYITLKDNEVYFLSSGTLYRRTLASDNANDAVYTTCPAAKATASCPADDVIATGVTNFSVNYYDADENEVTPANARSINLDLTLATKSGGKTITAHYSTRMVFRNE